MHIEFWRIWSNVSKCFWRFFFILILIPWNQFLFMNKKYALFCKQVLHCCIVLVPIYVYMLSILEFCWFDVSFKILWYSLNFWYAEKDHYCYWNIKSTTIWEKDCILPNPKWLIYEFNFKKFIWSSHF